MRALVLVAVLVGTTLLAVTGFGRADKADEPKAGAAKEGAEFRGKVIAVTVGARPDEDKKSRTVSFMEYAKVRKLGDRYFLTGRSARIKAYRKQPGKVMWFALSEVVQVAEFRSVDEADRYAESKE